MKREGFGIRNHRALSCAIRFIGLSLALILGNAAIAQDDASELQIVFWNVESGGAQPEPIARRIAAFQGVDVWGFSEVQNGSWVEAFAAAAAEGEGSEFRSILGTTGGGDRLAIVYDDGELELLGYEELNDINPMGRVRAPLVAHLKIRATGAEFRCCVNHLYRSREEQRHLQARLLNNWGRDQGIPVVLGGDMNFDWDITSNGRSRDAGFDHLTTDNVFHWLRPRSITKTQSSTRYNSILDMIFVTDSGAGWTGAPCLIVVEDGDFPDDDTTPDHRPVAVRFIVSELGSASAGSSSDEAGEKAQGDDAASTVAMLRAELESIEASVAAIESWLETVDRKELGGASDHARMTALLKRMRSAASDLRIVIDRYSEKQRRN